MLQVPCALPRTVVDDVRPGPLHIPATLQVVADLGVNSGERGLGI